MPSLFIRMFRLSGFGFFDLFLQVFYWAGRIGPLPSSHRVNNTLELWTKLWSVDRGSEVISKTDVWPAPIQIGFKRLDTWWIYNSGWKVVPNFSNADREVAFSNIGTGLLDEKFEVVASSPCVVVEWQEVGDRGIVDALEDFISIISFTNWLFCFFFYKLWLIFKNFDLFTELQDIVVILTIFCSCFENFGYVDLFPKQNIALQIYMYLLRLSIQNNMVCTYSNDQCKTMWSFKG